MTTKELIQEEINNLSGEELEELYRLIKHFTQAKQQGKNKSLMSKLKGIKIDGPADFAANHDLYATGVTGAKADLG